MTARTTTLDLHSYHYPHPRGPMPTADSAADFSPLKIRATHAIPIKTRRRRAGRCIVPGEYYPEDLEADENAKDAHDRLVYEAATWRMYNRIMAARMRQVSPSSSERGNDCVPRCGHADARKLTSRPLTAAYPDDHNGSSLVRILHRASETRRIDPPYSETEAMLFAPFSMDAE